MLTTRGFASVGTPTHGTMKKVVDASALRSEILKNYLSASRNNVAIVTDHLAMELFKGDGQTNVSHSLRILAAHPDQVAVLKPTHAILKSRPRGTGLHARFIDEEQTDGFVCYCRFLLADSTNEVTVAADRERKQFVANRRHDRMKGNVETIRSTIQQLKKRYKPEELKALRRKEVIPGDFWLRFTDDLFDNTIAFHREVPQMPGLKGANIFYSYAFRYTLCAFARAVDWIAEGGYDTAPEAKLMNDYVDMGYAAYATFYDGLLTEDKKLEEIHAFAVRLMQRVFLKADARFNQQ